MPKAIGNRRIAKLQSAPNEPMLRSKPVPFWAPPKGVNYIARSSRIEPSYLWDAQDWVVIDGRLELRRPIAHLGAAAGRPCEVGSFVTTDGFLHTFFITTGTVGDPGTLKYWNGSSWILPTGAPSLTGNQTEHLSYTAWNNKMVWTNGKDGVYELDWSSHTVTEITTTYIPKFVTTWLSRIFMGNMNESGTVLPARMRWSEKNDNTNFDDPAFPGWGNEDFLSTPGGYVDQFQAMIPVNDVQALVIKENSTWLISETGNVDAPVRTGRQFANLGSKAPRSIVSVVGGALGLFNDGIYIVSESGVKNIGQQIIRRIQSNVLDFDSCVGAYDNDLKRYTLVTFDNELQQTVAYQYSFPDESWMPQLYRYRVSSISYATSALVGLTIDSSPGTFDAAVGTIDSEIGSSESSQLYMGGGTSDGYFVYKEVATDDPTIIEPIGTIAKLTTGLLQAGSPLQHTELLEVNIEYESGAAVGTYIEYSTDLGATWTVYSVGSLPMTTGPGTYRYTKTLIGHNIQLRFNVYLLTPEFRLLAFVPSLVVGGEVYPESVEFLTQVPWNPIPTGITQIPFNPIP